jgi:uncharacterized protein (DUF58 family)
MSSALPPAIRLLNPAALVRRRFRAWWQQRIRRTDTLLLTQRNVYILPTRAGLTFGLTLLVLLVASINYQLSLGYVLTFLLAGSGAMSMHLTHGTLRGLTLHLRPPQAVFAGTPALLDITLTSDGRARFGIGLRMEDTPGAALNWSDVPAGAQAQAQVSFLPAQRGRHAVPTVCVETRFPLGLFRAWAVWRPAAEFLVYPRPEHPPAALPAAHAVPGGPATRRSTGSGEVEGVRSYRRGDPLKLVAWKKAARSLEAGGDLVSRDTSASVQQELWLDWQLGAGLDPEARLSRLCAWVLAADRAGVDSGLRMPGTEVPPAQGDAHRNRCLEVLALWPR